MRPSLHALGDFLEHPLGGPAADILHAGVARHPLDRALAHKAHAAVELHAIVHDFVDELTAIRLDHRHFAGGVDALRVEPGGVIDKLTPGFDFGRQPCEPLANGFARPQWRTEGLARAHIVEREIECGLRLAHRHRADGDALVLEIAHDRIEAAAFLAEYILGRYAAFVEM